MALLYVCCYRNQLDMESLQIGSLYNYHPREDEKEKTSFCYLASVAATAVGLPFPIINLFASILFFISNRRATYFVKWHCTQALLSQFTVFVINTIALVWTLRILFGSLAATDSYFGFVITVLIFSVIEFVVNITAAIKLRKGIHTEWWFWGALTYAVLKPSKP